MPEIYSTPKDANFKIDIYETISFKSLSKSVKFDSVPNLLTRQKHRYFLNKNLLKYNLLLKTLANGTIKREFPILDLL